MVCIMTRIGSLSESGSSWVWCQDNVFPKEMSNGSRSSLSPCER